MENRQKRYNLFKLSSLMRLFIRVVFFVRVDLRGKDV